MKRAIVVPVLLIVAVAAALWFWLGRSDPADEGWLGYVEGEAIEVAAPVAGTLARLDVVRGGQVRAGQRLFSLNAVTNEAETRRLEAQLAQAQAQRADLAKARQRPAELGIPRAQQAAARAELVRAQREYERISTLAARGFATRAQLEATRAAMQSAQAALDQARASEASGQLPGREDQIAAADAAVAAAGAAVLAQQRRGIEIAPTATVSALVEQTYFNPGEWVPANAPIVRLLEPGRIKIRFYAPEDRIAALAPGTRVTVSCDGCGAPFTATVRFVSERAEFTPPVIYSERARSKLVFLVEAAPEGSAARLRPGLPVEVRPR